MEKAVKRYLFIFALLCSFLVAACGGKVVVDDTHTFESDRWQSFEPQVFDFNIRNAEDCYDIYVTAVIDTALYHEKMLPLAVNLTGASGESRVFRYDMVVRDKNSWIGEYRDGLLYSKRCIRQYFFFNGTGQFSLTFKQITSRYELSGIHALMLRIERSKLEYPK